METERKHAVDQPQIEFKRGFERNGVQVEVFEREDGLICLEELNEIAEANKRSEGRGNKKILLIDFKTLQKVPENQDYSFQNFLNLGVHRLAGYLQDYNVPVSVVSYGEISDQPEALMDLVSANDIIGVSNLTSQVEDAYDFCRKVKKQFGDEKMIVGGSEHYLGSDQILTDQKTTGIDICCIGQGELPLLALALGQPVEKVGSLVYCSEKDQFHISIVENERFQRLIDTASVAEKGEMSVLNTRPALPFSIEEIKGPAPFHELNGLDEFEFDGSFATQTGSGCLYGCDFCPNKKFFGAKYEVNLGAAKEEILNFKKQNQQLHEVFLTFTDAMLNPSEEHLRSVIKFMQETNKEGEPRIYWFAYLSAPRIKAGETLELWREKWDKILEDMAVAGCIMAAVGVEEVIYDRNLVHHKGQDADTASEFIDLVGKHMLTRSLLIMGAPEHFYIDRNKTLKGKEYLDDKYRASDRELVKGEILDYMSRHPQALYRMNPWTLVYGTDSFYKYQDCLSGDFSDPSNLKLLDHLHSVIDPGKMYAHLEKEYGIAISQEKRWVKAQTIWFKLMEEIMEEYIQSPDYLAYLETLKENEINGQKGLIYKIALKFRENVSAQIKKNRSNKKEKTYPA